MISELFDGIFANWLWVYGTASAVNVSLKRAILYVMPLSHFLVTMIVAVEPSFTSHGWPLSSPPSAANWMVLLMPLRVHSSP